MTDYTNSALSYGGGVNTATMAIKLIEDGWRGPIAFADTGGEKPETYCHIKWMEANVFKPVGLKLERLSWKFAPSEVIEIAQQELHDKRVIGKTLEEFCLDRQIIPLQAVSWCSVQFKRSLLEAFRKWIGAEFSLIGIDAGEPTRLRDDPHVRYPLVEWLGWRRIDCVKFLINGSIPVPPKSSCFFCPNQKIVEWRELWKLYPDLYERAAILERTASIRHQKYVTLREDFSLDEWCKRFEAEIEMNFGEQNITNLCICGL